MNARSTLMNGLKEIIIIGYILPPEVDVEREIDAVTGRRVSRRRSIVVQYGRHERLQDVLLDAELV